jgi:predicted secreted hydrolase
LAADDASPPVPISLPQDDGPHDALTEWWYYTGHLQTAKGALFGFEQVTFKGTRGRLAGLVSHVAITEGARRRFRYDQRATLDDGSAARPAVGFDLAIGDWSMRGAGGDDALTMTLPGYAYALQLTSRKPPVLHGSDDYIRSDSGAESYYYSRTRQAVSGLLVVGQPPQWGDLSSGLELACVESISDVKRVAGVGGPGTRHSPDDVPHPSGRTGRGNRIPGRQAG